MIKTDRKDLMGRETWDDVWEGSEVPIPVTPSYNSITNHRDLQLHRYFKRLFADVPKGRLLEVGCAKSQWLPYFAREYGFQVTGLDYSEIGCKQSEALLEHAGVEGTIFQRDMFDSNKDLAENFDAVISFGLVEHFTDTTNVLHTLGNFLKPCGVLVTVVPNTSMMPGMLLRIINKQLYDQHIPLTPKALSKATAEANLHELESHYFMTLNLSALSLALAQRGNRWWAKSIWNVFDGLTMLTSYIIRLGLPELPNAITSPYIISTATKPIKQERKS